MGLSKTRIFVSVLVVVCIMIIFYGKQQFNKNISNQTVAKAAIEINNRVDPDEVTKIKVQWIEEALKAGKLDLKQENKNVTEAEFLVLLLTKYGESPTITDNSVHWAEGYYEKAIEEYDYPLSSKTNRDKILNLNHAAELIAASQGESLKGNDAVKFLINNQILDIEDNIKDNKLLTRTDALQLVDNTSKQGLYVLQKNNKDKKKVIVSLGDSISLGWGLTKGGQPSNYGFLDVVGKEKPQYHIFKMASPGLATGQLLEKLNKPLFQEKLAQSDKIVLDIGSVDLLGGASEYLEKVREGNGTLPSIKELDQIKASQENVIVKIDEIIEKIRGYSASTIYLYGLYNPIPKDNLGFDFGNSIIKKINKHFIEIADNSTNIIYIDDYNKFNGKQASLVINGEIHPTKVGQEVLADLLIDHLK